METARAIKSTAARALITLSGWYLRNRATSVGKAALWNRICVPLLSWRDISLICRTTFGARFHVTPTQFIENRICFFGSWEPMLTDLFQSFLHPGDVVIDVGANVGYFTILASKLVAPTGKVFAVEPSQRTREKLVRNLQLNDITNVDILPIAAWHEAGEACFYTHSTDAGGSSLRALNASPHREHVVLDRLDSSIDRSYWQRVRLIKIDVEGAECQALDGLSGLLQSNRSLAVVVECEEQKLSEMGKSAGELFELLSGYFQYSYSISNDYRADFYLQGVRGQRLMTVDQPPASDSYLLFTNDVPIWEKTAADEYETRSLTEIAKGM